MSKLNGLRMTCALLLLCVATASVSSAQTFKTLLNFNLYNGADPEYVLLVQGPDGDLYGTTGDGGTQNSGTVFKITPGGRLTVLHSFNGTDGFAPHAGLVRGSDGNFYGTTQETVFKITPGGTLTTLHTFQMNEGAAPDGALIQATDGNFYGTTYGGGIGAHCINGCGTVFKMTPGGTLTTLHKFDSRDGSYPYAALVQGTNGNLYGTTFGGGRNGLGTVFRITPKGRLTTLLSFDKTDGANPAAGLIQASDGNFYGTTAQGGVKNGGTVFRITPGGTLTTLYSFCAKSGCADGRWPYAGLTQATDGNFYGTTSTGGIDNAFGTVFQITPAGALTTLHRFKLTDGDAPLAAPFQATDGKFYGTTDIGGNSANCFVYGCGTLFSLSMGLAPFVETQPAIGTVGTPVTVLGTNLTGSTNITFNGTPATFTVVSKSEITTTVPTGATTGTVDVTTPKGTLKSNVVFRVTK